MNPDLEDALEAIAEMMVYDKGPSEEEYLEWCDKWLPLVQQYGYLTYLCTGD